VLAVGLGLEALNHRGTETQRGLVNAAVLASSAFLRDSCVAWGIEGLEPQMNADERRCCGAVPVSTGALKESRAACGRAIILSF
jgi:hypothetical protein